RAFGSAQLVAALLQRRTGGVGPAFLPNLGEPGRCRGDPEQDRAGARWAASRSSESAGRWRRTPHAAESGTSLSGLAASRRRQGALLLAERGVRWELTRDLDGSRRQVGVGVIASQSRRLITK